MIKNWQLVRKREGKLEGLDGLDRLDFTSCRPQDLNATVAGGAAA